MCSAQPRKATVLTVQAITPAVSLALFMSQSKPERGEQSHCARSPLGSWVSLVQGFSSLKRQYQMLDFRNFRLHTILALHVDLGMHFSHKTQTFCDLCMPDTESTCPFPGVWPICHVIRENGRTRILNSRGIRVGTVPSYLWQGAGDCSLVFGLLANRALTFANCFCNCLVFVLCISPLHFYFSAFWLHCLPSFSSGGREGGSEQDTSQTIPFCFW